jgi:hypothetical protein
MSDGSALPLEAEIAAHCIPARETERTIRTREAGSMPAHTHTRETPPAFEECGYACRGGCIAPLAHKRNAITGAMGGGSAAATLRQKVESEKAAHSRRAAWNEEQRNLTVKGKSDGRDH